MSTPPSAPPWKQSDCDDSGWAGFEVFYEMKTGCDEMGMLGALWDVMRAHGLFFQYLAYGNIRLFNADADMATDEQLEVMEAWLDSRADLLSYDISPLSVARNPLRASTDANRQQEIVLLLIPPRLH